MVGKPKRYENIHKKMDFKDAKTNFFNAARYGMSAQFYWNNEYIPSHKLILDELLPMAYRGLYSMGVSPRDAEHYLTMIENRVKSYTGSQWMRASYRNLLTNNKPYEALHMLAAGIFKKQMKDFPVSTWQILKPHTPTLITENKVVKHIMNTQIYSVGEKDSIELVLNIMLWKNIHHMPVINDEKELVGLLTWEDVQHHINDSKQLKKAVDQIMLKNPITITQYDDLKKALDLMSEKDIDCLPVVLDNKLIGIITSKDL